MIKSSKREGAEDIYTYGSHTTTNRELFCEGIQAFDYSKAAVKNFMSMK